MDKKTYDALKELINFAENAVGFDGSNPDVHYKAFKQVKDWMEEVEKDVD